MREGGQSAAAALARALTVEVVMESPPPTNPPPLPSIAQCVSVASGQLVIRTPVLLGVLLVPVPPPVNLSPVRKTPPYSRSCAWLEKASSSKPTDQSTVSTFGKPEPSIVHCGSTPFACEEHTRDNSLLAMPTQSLEGWKDTSESAVQVSTCPGRAVSIAAWTPFATTEEKAVGARESRSRRGRWRRDMVGLGGGRRGGRGVQDVEEGS